MTLVQLSKDSIDLGIVVSDADKALAFYRDLLGFPLQGEMPMPGGAKMYRLLCGTSLLKIIHAPGILLVRRRVALLALLDTAISRCMSPICRKFPIVVPPLATTWP